MEEANEADQQGDVGQPSSGGAEGGGGFLMEMVRIKLLGPAHNSPCRR